MLIFIDECFSSPWSEKLLFCSKWWLKQKLITGQCVENRLRNAQFCMGHLYHPIEGQGSTVSEGTEQLYEQDALTWTWHGCWTHDSVTVATVTCRISAKNWTCWHFIMHGGGGELMRAPTALCILIFYVVIPYYKKSLEEMYTAFPTSVSFLQCFKIKLVGQGRGRKRADQQFLACN